MNKKVTIAACSAVAAATVIAAGSLMYAPSLAGAPATPTPMHDTLSGMPVPTPPLTPPPVYSESDDSFVNVDPVLPTESPLKDISKTEK